MLVVRLFFRAFECFTRVTHPEPFSDSPGQFLSHSLSPHCFPAESPITFRLPCFRFPLRRSGRSSGGAAGDGSAPTNRRIHRGVLEDVFPDLVSVFFIPLFFVVRKELHRLDVFVVFSLPFPGGSFSGFGAGVRFSLSFQEPITRGPGGDAALGGGEPVLVVCGVGVAQGA